MQTYEDDGWLRDIPFLVAACAMHGLFLSLLPALRWGAIPMPRPSVPVEFVTELPKAPQPTPALAPIPQAPGPSVPTPAAGGAKTSHRPKLSAAQRAARVLRRAQARYRAKAIAIAKAETARVKAAAQAEAARARVEQLKAERLAKEQRLAAARAERSRQRAEISQQLATMVDPDEKLTDAPNDPSLGPVIGGTGEAAGLKVANEAVYDVEREGYDPAEGKGSGGGGGGLSWAIDGPVGNRRIVRRTLPKSPAWVSQRGLELAVQIKFQVLPDGSVKTGAVIQKTSGFPEIDRRALDAIRAWRFEAIAPRADLPEVWGRVTFRFLMG